MIQRLACIGVASLLPLGVFGQSPVTKPAFQIADVRVSPHSIRPLMQGGFLRGDRYVLRQASMVDLIATAYSVQPENVLGGPSWLEFDRFDIVAKAPPATPPETLKLMLQDLLADRFQVVLHKDTQPLDAFVLTEGKGKPKLKESDGLGSSECKLQPATPSEHGKIPQIKVSCHNMTMGAFATDLRQMGGGYLTSPVPVVDRTGLKGAWDFDLKWTGRGDLARAGSDGLSIFDAVDKELGLKLEFLKYPAAVLVVDSANETPTENPPGVEQTLPQHAAAEFEVAVLKPSLPETKRGGRGFQSGGRIDFQAVPLSALIAAAWNLNLSADDEIAGAPKWVSSARFDLMAKAYTTAAGSAISTSSAPANGVPTDIDMDDLRLMLRALLADRLKMAAHLEDRPQTAYTLVAAKPKLTKADPMNRTGCKVGQAPPGKNSAGEWVTCRNVTMAQFAEQLSMVAPIYIRNPVLDASGIEGAWDFTLTFSPVPPKMASGDSADATNSIMAVSLFDAIERQLGMKLEMHKRPLPVLVIDHIEEKPDN